MDAALQDGLGPRPPDDQAALVYRALVIEDDPIVAGLIEHMLSRRRFEVQIASDGRQADALIETMPCPSVVVLDVMLPFVDGFELIERIRRTPGWERVPIVMLTSKSQESYAIRAFTAGVSDYVVKPLRVEEFVARIRRLVER